MYNGKLPMFGYELCSIAHVENINNSFFIQTQNWKIGNWDFLQDFIYQNLENCKNFNLTKS